MKIRTLLGYIIAAAFWSFALPPGGARARLEKETAAGPPALSMNNGLIQCSVAFEGNALKDDIVSALPAWTSRPDSSQLAIETDADYQIEVMWTDWSAPGKVNNAENPIVFSKRDFELVRSERHEQAGSIKEMEFLFRGKQNPLELRLVYQIESSAFWVRRKIAVRDPEKNGHFLRAFCPRAGLVSGDLDILKPGGFGQPAAFRTGQGGGFFGLEYVASENKMTKEQGKTFLRCGQEMGERIGDSWVESDWVVEGLTPDPYVKKWFFEYLDKIRVAPVRPYLLYNSWYDLRAPVMVKDQNQSLTEKNVLRIIEEFRKRMFRERGLKLDAFVLDDGWDVYQSDWVLNRDQFPNGLSPLVEALAGMGTRLGIWLGPTGGYSHRDWRVGWMGSHGYETVGGQMCLAGRKYHELLKRRFTDFVRQEGIRYFKWDGIQFSCSETGHGHLPDIYSRRAVIESLADLCRSVRAEQEGLFLNITSGTWLSPWWLKLANTIWMQGGDYGYADVPSLSPRDRAITYRDSVLYEDLVAQEFWFPLANLMTHGIIKGHLQMLGGTDEPLEKFTNSAVMYFARGVSMWELYISPDALSDPEWDALAGAIRWAQDRFPILCSTEMVGGDPDRRQAYGYVHFKGTRGIVVARNPFIEPQTLRIKLSPALGIDPADSSLVVERVYPNRMVFPQFLSAAGEGILDIPLQGYETAVYEIYPVEEADKPLLAGARFEKVRESSENVTVNLYEGIREARLLNPEKVQSVSYRGKTFDPKEFAVFPQPLAEPVAGLSSRVSAQKNLTAIDLEYTLSTPVESARLAILLEPRGGVAAAELPEVSVFVDGKETEARVESEKSRWAWSVVNVPPGKHTSQVKIKASAGSGGWTGSASVWLTCLQNVPGEEITFALKAGKTASRIMPPLPHPSGMVEKKVKIGEFSIVTN